MKLRLAYILVTFFLLQACGNNPSQENQSEALQQEMQSRKITRISQGQLLEKAMDMGESISTQAEDHWLKQLKPIMNQAEIAESIQACSIDSISAIMALAKESGTTIKRVALTPIDPANKTNKLEAELIDAYLYNLENNIPLTGNVQSLNNKELLFTKAIIFSDTGCLKCHGNAELANSKAREAILSSYNSSKEAFGKQPGQLAGMWSISIPHTAVVKELTNTP